MNPRRRHKAKARREGRPPARREPIITMRPRTALLLLPTWWHARIQSLAADGWELHFTRASIGW
jgi:hypothetical protein